MISPIGGLETELIKEKQMGFLDRFRTKKQSKKESANMSRRNFIKGSVGAIAGTALKTTGIGAAVNFLASKDAKADYMTGGLPNIFLQKRISKQLFNAAKALWLGNYAQYANTVGPNPKETMFKVITGRGTTYNGESISTYKIPLEDWYNEPAVWFLMEKYQQVFTGGRGDLYGKIVGFSEKESYKNRPLYEFVGGLNWFTNTYLFDWGSYEYKAEDFLLKSIFLAAYETEAIAFQHKNEYQSTQDINIRTQKIIEVRDRLMKMKDKERPYVALCATNVLECLYWLEEGKSGANRVNINRNLEQPIRKMFGNLKIRGPPFNFKKGIL